MSCQSLGNTVEHDNFATEMFELLFFLSNWKSYFHGWKSTKLIEHCKGKWNNWCLIRPTETGIDWRYNLVLSRLNFYSPFWRTSLLLLLDEKKNIGTGWEGRGGPCPAPKVCQTSRSVTWSLNTHAIIAGREETKFVYENDFERECKNAIS